MNIEGIKTLDKYLLSQNKKSLSLTQLIILHKLYETDLSVENICALTGRGPDSVFSVLKEIKLSSKVNPGGLGLIHNPAFLAGRYTLTAKGRAWVGSFI